MKKYILSLLLVATLVAAFIVPTMGGDVEDTFPGNATLYLTHSDDSMYTGMSGHLNYTLEDGYLFMKTDTHIQSPNKVDGTEILNVVAVNGSSLDNIESFEYKDSTDGAWTNAFNYIVNTNRSFTQRLSISRFYRVKFKGDVSLEMQYKVKPEGAKGYESGLRCISIVKSGDTYTADATFIKAEDITTTQATSTTTVAPTAEPTSEVTTAAPTKAPAVKAPGKAKIKKVWRKKRSAKKLKIKLAKVKNAKGYKVCVYKNKKKAKKHKKAIVTKYTTKLKYTIKSKKLKNKKKLFVGARAYNVASNGIKVYGPWAKIKKVKVK